MAERHCRGCHLLPRPEQLPAETWPFVLTWMSHYLGVRQLSEPFRELVGEHLIPPQPLIGRESYERLFQYYVSGAPPQAEFRIARGPNPPLAGFRPRVPELDIPTGEIVTLVQLDRAQRDLYVGLGRARELRVYRDSAREVFRGQFDSEPIFAEPVPDGFRVTLLGSLDQSRLMNAQVIDVRSTAKKKHRRRMLVAGYHRMTQSRGADLDGDGREDLLLVGFGDGFGPGFGRVSILWGAPGFDAAFARAPSEIPRGLLTGAWSEQVLLDRAGALGSEIRDFDGDGRLDVLIVTAQARQELLLFRNQGSRRFETRLLVEQFPGFGYNQLVAADFDGDGDLDLLTVNGNNMEIPDPPLRPYHGIRILLNDGDLRFREAYFYPMYGALQARVHDLDGDGDLDVAAIAFYADWEAETPETFTLLENRGDLRFTASSLGGEHWGRWLSLDVGDLDGDGRPDIALGAGNLPGGGIIPRREESYRRYRNRLQAAPSLLILSPEAMEGATAGAGSSRGGSAPR